MTMPHLTNCPHQGEGWCLECVLELANTLERVQEYAQKQCDYNTDEALLWAQVTKICQGRTGASQRHKTAPDYETQRANARLIVQAVNNYAALLSALQTLVNDVECYCAEHVAYNRPCGRCEAREAVANLSAIRKPNQPE